MQDVNHFASTHTPYYSSECKLWSYSVNLTTFGIFIPMQFRLFGISLKKKEESSPLPEEFQQLEKILFFKSPLCWFYNCALPVRKWPLIIFYRPVVEICACVSVSVCSRTNRITTVWFRSHPIRGSRETLRLDSRLQLFMEVIAHKILYMTRPKHVCMFY